MGDWLNPAARARADARRPERGRISTVARPRRPGMHRFITACRSIPACAKGSSTALRAPGSFLISVCHSMTRLMVTAMIGGSERLGAPCERSTIPCDTNYTRAPGSAPARGRRRARRCGVHGRSGSAPARGRRLRASRAVRQIQELCRWRFPKPCASSTSSEPGPPEGLQVGTRPGAGPRRGRGADPGGGGRRQPGRHDAAQGQLPPAARAPPTFLGLEVSGNGRGDRGGRVRSLGRRNEVCALLAGGGYAEYCPGSPRVAVSADPRAPVSV